MTVVATLCNTVCVLQCVVEVGLCSSVCGGPGNVSLTPSGVRWYVVVIATTPSL